MMQENFSVSHEGHFCIGGVDATVLASRYGTPLYVMDENRIRQNCRRLKRSIERFYNGNGMVLYASKAFSCKEIYRIVQSEGLGIDIVSGGELYTACAVGFPAENMYFHGNNKTVSELAMALEYGVGHIVADNFYELETLSSLAVSSEKTVSVLLRIKPGIDAHTHQFIRTGQIDSKFGFALETGEAEEAFQKVLTLPGIRLTGIHCHIGSQIFDIEPFEHAARIMLEFAEKMYCRYGFMIQELNLGGGFGICYLPSDDPTALESYMERVANVVNDFCAAKKLPVPRICIEPGRSIVGDAGITLYTVGTVKQIPDVRTYVSVDGGMTDNPRYILYGSDYEILCANKADQPKDTVVTVAGRCCESGDLLQENAPLQKVASGDILAVFCTGAYNYSMASNYNRVPRPAVVMVKDGADKVIIKRESYDDLLRNDR